MVNKNIVYASYTLDQFSQYRVQYVCTAIVFPRRESALHCWRLFFLFTYRQEKINSLIQELMLFTF